MRLIGHLPSEANAITFGEFLTVEGIENEIEADKEGWAVWIHSEDEWQRAKGMLSTFLANPRDPQYAGHSARARRVRQQVAEDSEAASRRTLDRRAVFRATMPYGVGALTMVLVCLCVAITLLSWTGYKERIYAELFIERVRVGIDRLSVDPSGLQEIRHGEFWRLLTPALVHLDPLHLLFNMLWLLDLGSMIEARGGTGRLGLKVILIGVASNLAQYYVKDPFFNGFSGVNYGLFGYIWVRGRLDPRSGLYVNPQTVAMMVIWFLLCLAGVIKNVANMAHAAGLGMGLIWGFLASLPAMRRRPGD